METLKKLWNNINNVDVSIEDQAIKKMDDVLAKNIINFGMMALIVAVTILILAKKIK